MSKLAQLQKIRLEKLEKLRNLGVDPYPAITKREQSIKKARKMDGKNVAIAGRLMSSRGHGKLIFVDLKDESGKVQVAFKADFVKKETFSLIKLIDIGDFIAVQGKVGKSIAGEVTVFASDFQFLVKTTRPLPDKWYGFKDIEDRYRKRYLDMILNPKVTETLKMRSKVIEAIREYLDKRDFIEVETPTLQPVYGGGFARPFVTYHNKLEADFYLRISDEMYLKRLIVGGMEKVYEITKVFRNEGIDKDHNPEFTMFEAQIAFQDYVYGMDLIEAVMEYATKKVLGKTKVNYQGTDIEMRRPWKRLKLVEAVKEYTGVDPLKWKTLNEARSAIKKMGLLKEKEKELARIQSIGELIAFAFEEFVEEKLIQPTFIYDYPIEVSPLAKKCKDPRFTQRFEQFAFGCELGNNYTELNDPVDLTKRFVEEKKREEGGFEEAHQTDYDYLKAIEHGFPPTCGIAIGVDRFVMLLTNSKNIKEVIAFPTLRPIRKRSEDEYDYRARKIVAIVNKDLKPAQALNALGHMSFSAGHFSGESWMGAKELIDASGTKHTGIAKYPFIVLQASTKELRNVIKNAREKGVSFVDYPQEMFDTGTDDDLSAALGKKKEADMVYHGVLLTAESKILKKITGKLQLYKYKDKIISSKSKGEKMKREQAIELLHQKMKNINLRKHCYAVEAVMRALAKHFGQDEDLWGVAGLIHDADYEINKNNPEKHVLTVVEWLKERQVDPRIIQAVFSHGWKFVDGCPKPQTKMDWALYCCDELTGFIVGVALVRPDKKLSSVSVESILKKWKVKAFCAPVDRAQIELCEEKLGIKLNDFIQIALSAMQGISSDLGL